MARTPVIAAFAATYLLWGATFLGIRVAVETYAPFWMSGLRFGVAGALVLAFVAVRGPRGDPLAWWQATATGALFCLGTHGIAPHLGRVVPSGIMAVFMAATPLLMAGIGAVLGTERIGRATGGALLLGLLGVAVLAWPAGDAELSVAQAAWLLAAALCWAIGSLLTKRWTAAGTTDLAAFAGRQMVSGAALLGVASGVSGQGWLPALPDARTGGAILFLATGGTIAAYFSYLYLLRRVSLAKASSYTFVNPVVAVALGAWFAAEPVTGRLLVALPLIVVAVVLTMWRGAAAPAHRASVPDPCRPPTDATAGTTYKAL